MTTIEMDAENFNYFLRCITNLKEICNDIDIKNGVIRQRSNNLTSVFEMDLTYLSSTLSEANIPITNLKKKLDLLKTFAGQNVTIDVVEGETESESYFTVADDQSSIQFKFPSIEFMDNKYMTEEELENIFKLEEDNIIIDETLTGIITERIKVVTENFNTQAIQVKFDNDTASISAITQSKDQFAKFKSDISSTIDFGGNFSSNLSTIPFSIEHDDDVSFKMYKEEDQNVSLNLIKTTLGEIDINIYSRSAIIEEE